MNIFTSGPMPRIICYLLEKNNGLEDTYITLEGKEVFDKCSVTNNDFVFYFSLLKTHQFVDYKLGPPPNILINEKYMLDMLSREGISLYQLKAIAEA